MTPEQERAIQEHAQAIAAILYEQTEAEQVSTLAGIEKTVRDQVLQHVTPEIGVFLSAKVQEQNQEEPDTLKAY